MRAMYAWYSCIFISKIADMKTIFTLCMFTIVNITFANDYIFSNLALTCQSNHTVRLEFSVPSEYNTLAYPISISYNAIDWQIIDTIYANQSGSLPAEYIQYYEEFDSLPHYAKVEILNFDWISNYEEITYLTCNSLNENISNYTVINNYVHIYSHVIQDITATFSIFDLNLNLLHTEDIHFSKGYNHHVINYRIDSFFSYIFICRSLSMMQCSRIVSMAY